MIARVLASLGRRKPSPLQASDVHSPAYYRELDPSNLATPGTLRMLAPFANDPDLRLYMALVECRERNSR